MLSGNISARIIRSKKALNSALKKTKNIVNQLSRYENLDFHVMNMKRALSKET